MKIGIDFGGTKTEVICLQDNGKELYRKRIPTARESYQKTIQDFVSLIKEAEESVGETASVGIAIPGNISTETGIIKSANTTWIVGKPFRDDLSQALNREIRIDNDANCFAISEAVDGAGMGHDLVFAVIIGTGCGGGLAINKKPWAGKNEIAGEWGHNPLPFPRVYVDKLPEDNLYLTHPHEDDLLSKDIFPKKEKIPHYTTDPNWNEYPGPLCYCGKRGCLERWISGTGLKRDYEYITNTPLSTHSIIENAKEGEPLASQAFERYIDRIARGLAYIVDAIDPDVIVLGGGMSNVEEIYTQVPKVWNKYIHIQKCNTEILPAKHGDSSGIRGAAWLWNEKET